MDTERYRNYLALGRALASEAGGRLLFLTVFGSVLYGTDIPERSDEDVRGIYLPAPCTDPLHAPGLHYSSAAQGTRSTAGDTDCDLLPLDRWLLSDLPRGDTGALDLLYAPSRPSCLLFVEPALRPVFKTPRIFLNLCSGEACRDYAFRQGSRYGLAGTRTGALYRVWKALDSGAFPLKAPLRGYAGKLAELAESPLHCTLLEDGGLRLAGSVDEGCVRLGVLRDRVRRRLQGHLSRVQAAMEGKNVDWKALSHAVRAIRQQEELLETGRLVFPLRDRAEILSIKKARCPFRKRKVLLPVDWPGSWDSGPRHLIPCPGRKKRRGRSVPLSGEASRAEASFRGSCPSCADKLELKDRPSENCLSCVHSVFFKH